MIAWRDATSQQQRETHADAVRAERASSTSCGACCSFGCTGPTGRWLEVGLLWLSILLLIVVLGRYSRTAALLLVPYLLWVTFAAR